MDGPMRLKMMRNMVHLNQVPPLVMAGIDYFDKFQRRDGNQGTYYATEVKIETAITSTILSGTPIEKHVERITVDLLSDMPHVFIGEPLNIFMDTTMHKNVLADVVYTGIITDYVTSEHDIPNVLMKLPVRNERNRLPFMLHRFVAGNAHWKVVFGSGKRRRLCSATTATILTIPADR